MTCCEEGNVVSNVLATWLKGFRNTQDTNLEIQNRIDATVRKVCDYLLRRLARINFTELYPAFDL